MRVKFTLFLVLAVLVLFAGFFFGVDVEKIRAFFNKIPFVYAGPMFILFYVAGTFLADLKDPLRLVGAIAYGAYISTLLIYVAEMINAAILFHAAKFLGRGTVENAVKGRLKDFYMRLEGLNFWWIVLLRAIPAVSYRVLDLGFGLTKLPFRRYFAACLVASLPRIFWIQYPLSAVGSLSPQKMMAYFLQKPLVLWWYFAYTVFVFVAVIAVHGKLFKPKNTNDTGGNEK